MTAEAVPAAVAETANERLKRTFSSWFWGSMIVATFAPRRYVRVLAGTDRLRTSRSRPRRSRRSSSRPRSRSRRRRRQISRPATPVMATADIDEDITIAPTTFEENPIEDLPPPRKRLRPTCLRRRPSRRLPSRRRSSTGTRSCARWSVSIARSCGRRHRRSGARVLLHRRKRCGSGHADRPELGPPSAR